MVLFAVFTPVATHIAECIGGGIPIGTCGLDVHLFLEVPAEVILLQLGR